MKYFWLPLTLILTTALTAYSQTTTFVGRVFDENTGQGIPNVAVVALGNQTGTRVALSDSQGNYTLSMGANNNIRVRAYRTNFVFNLYRSYSSRLEFRSPVHTYCISLAPLCRFPSLSLAWNQSC